MSNKKITDLPSGSISDSSKGYLGDSSTGQLYEVSYKQIKDYASTGGGSSSSSSMNVYNVITYGADKTGVSDSTSAIQTAINACDAAGGGTVYIPNGTYIIGGALQTSVQGYNPNCQIYIPAHDALISTKRNSITIQGESINSVFGGGYTVVSSSIPTTGVILRSTINGSGTNPSVFGCVITGSGEIFNYTDMEFNDFALLVNTNSGSSAISVSGFNLVAASKVSMTKIQVTPDIYVQRTSNPAVNEVAGIAVSNKDNGGPNTFTECIVIGFKYGYVFGEHTQLDNIQVFACNYACSIISGNYSVTGRITVQASNHGLYFPTSSILGVGSGGSNGYVDLFMEYESITQGFWYDTVNTIHDPNNLGIGSVTTQGFATIIKSGGNLLSTSKISPSSTGKIFTSGLTILNGGGTVNGINISASLATSAATLTYFNNQSTATACFQIGLAGSSFGVGYNNNGYLLNTAPNGGLLFGTAGSAIAATFGVNGLLGLGMATPTALLHISGSSTTNSALRLASGAAPTSPNDGDIWYDGTNLKMRIGVTTKTFTLT